MRERRLEAARPRVRHRARVRGAAGSGQARPVRSTGSSRARSIRPVRDALRLGAYQLWRTRVPARAAVSTTVDLVRAVSPRSAGFANAVMRRVAENPRAARAAVRGRPARAPRRRALPSALDRRRVRRRHSATRAPDELAAALAADDARPAVHLVARDDDPRRPARRSRRGQPSRARGRRAPSICAGGDPGELAAVRDGAGRGAGRGQPAGGARPGRRRRPGPRTIDLAAGPGGKAALLAALAWTSSGWSCTRPAPGWWPARGVRGRGRRRPAYRRCAAGDPRTGCCSTRPAPVSVRCAAVPRRGGGVSAADIEPLAVAAAGAAGQRAARWSGPAGWWPTRPARRTRARPPACWKPCCAIHPCRSSRSTRDRCCPADAATSATGPTVQLWPHRHGTDAMFLALLRRQD